MIPSEPLHSPIGGVPPPAEVVPGFCCRIGTAGEIVDADDAVPWVSVELGVDKDLLRQPNAGIVPGVLRFFQRTSARHDLGPEGVRQTAASQPMWSFLLLT